MAGAANDRSPRPAAATPADARATRIGVVRYINTLPLIDGLGALAGHELVPDVPSRLIGRLASGDVDVALCSVIDSVRSPVPVKVVPVGMIGCRSRTLTVRLFSRVPLGAVRSVAADADSHTSRALAELVLMRRHGVRPAFADFPDASGGADPGTDAMLLIGDKVIADAPPADAWPHQADLGEEWHAWTGLPFVFATWLARADADDDGNARVRTAARVLDHQRRHNRGRLDAIVRREAVRHGWEPSLALHYLRDLLRYDLGPDARDGMARFLAECHAAGLSPAPGAPADIAW